MDITFQNIGVIHSPFIKLEEMPIQPMSDISGSGIVEIYPQFIDCIKDLEGFSHIYLIYHFHRIRYPSHTAFPSPDMEPRGIFATRAPNRPNPIGLSLVELVRIEKNMIHVDRLDVLDGTPLLDIKPYIPMMEPTKVVRIGWLENVKGKYLKSRKPG